MRRRVVAVDFDGVIRAANGEPVEGVEDGLLGLRPARLVVYTCRWDLKEVHRWLCEHHLDHFFEDISREKPKADAYLDDKAVHFSSWSSAPLAVREVLNRGA